MKVVNREQMTRIEREADAKGISFATMMENAGKALAEVIVCRMAPLSGTRILVLVGPGNNGGDGLAAARHLSEAGAQVHLYLLKPRPAEDPNWAQCQKMGIPCTLAEGDSGSSLQRLLSKAHWVVDALLGTGPSRPIKGKLKDILEAVSAERARRWKGAVEKLVLLGEVSPANLYPRPSPWVVAVDLPSGLDCDTGNIDPSAVPADITVTFAFPKVGHFGFPGASYVGELIVADIAIPPSLAADIPLEVATAEKVRALLPPRPLDAHKGTFGRALVVAGSANYTGAAYLSAASAIRVGAGLATLALPRSIHPVLASKLTEATFLLLPDDLGVIASEAYPLVAEALASYDALLVGPGLGREETTRRFVGQLLRGEGARWRQRIGFISTKEVNQGEARGRPTVPMVIDADGLNLLVQEPKWWETLGQGNVLTPHPGEMARLMDTSVEEIQADRLGKAREAASRWGQVVVLKGAYTLIASPEGAVTINPFANPGLASGGTGDVLAGIIVGLLAQGLSSSAAAIAGAFIHGLAAQRVAARVGEMGMAASDLLLALPEVLRDLRGRRNPPPLQRAPQSENFR